METYVILHSSTERKHDLVESVSRDTYTRLPRRNSKKANSFAGIHLEQNSSDVDAS